METVENRQKLCYTVLTILKGGCAMNIAGLQKMTLLDYPGRVACTVFLAGCNFRCPFCHNSDLLTGNAPAYMTDSELLSFLASRRGLLDGVCITGGEPTLQPQLPQLLKQIKTLGYAIKLDTNGAKPAVLKALVEEKLVDYVAMDIKNSREQYPNTAGISDALLPGIEESIRFLLSGKVGYELRTTVVKELHTAQDIENMGAWVKNLGDGKLPEKWFLQSYVHRDNVLQSDLHAPEKENLTKYAQILKPFVTFVDLRGVD